MKTAIIIPARYKSSRFPGKPLAKILGKEMILRVLNICAKAINKKNIYVATDDNRIKIRVLENNFQAIMTPKQCKTGTDRVAIASKKINARIFVNVQGDEPLINYKDIKKIISAKKKFPKSVICGYTKISKQENPKNLNLPKVVISKSNNLIYMSRLPIPGSKSSKLDNKKNFLKQVCIYAFNKNELNSFLKFGKKTYLEKFEDIEILRFFEIGIPIKMVELKKQSIAVDVKSDLKKVEIHLKNGKKN